MGAEKNYIGESWRGIFHAPLVNRITIITSNVRTGDFGTHTNMQTGSVTNTEVHTHTKHNHATSYS